MFRYPQCGDWANYGSIVHTTVRYTCHMKTNVTYKLDDRLLEAARTAVKEGAAHNMSDFVEQGIERRLRDLRREHIARNVEAASKDPLFVEDVREVTEAFEPTYR